MASVTRVTPVVRRSSLPEWHQAIRTCASLCLLSAHLKSASRSEQAFSADGGKTWEVNFKTQYTRAPGGHSE